MRRSLRLFVALAAICASLAPGRAALDISPADGLPDIWAYVHNAGGLPPTGDADGDGKTNAEEGIAGTNPKAAADHIRIKSYSKSGSNFTLTFPALAGKKYEIQGSTTPNGAGFAPLSPASVHVPTVDGDIPVTVPVGSKTLFRVVVSDLDSDSDGLTNYEERMVGLNANLADSNGDGTSDLAYVTAELGMPDTVSIRALDSLASEDGSDGGVFEISRTRSLFAITVAYAVGGTATPGSDYAAIATSVSFAQGEKTKTISVNPAADSSIESGESVTVTLLPPPPDLADDYTIGGSATASVIIAETTVAGGSGLRARYYDHASTVYDAAQNFGQTGTYAYTRTSTGNPMIGNIVVPFTYTGTPALQVGHVVRMTFTGGNLNNALYNNLNYNVTAVNAGVNFTLAISAPSLPTNSSSSCAFSIQSFPHPAVIDRVDATVNNTWATGTPNGNTYTPSSSPENYSSAWEGYLNPTVAGSYRFQLDADDKARVLLDTGSGLVEILEHGWDATPDTVGTFKISAAVNLAVPAGPANRYKIRVEQVETTGDARCRLQWSRDGAAFANIPAGNVLHHLSGTTYSYTRNVDLITGTIVVTLAAHPFAVGNSVDLLFSTGNLFTPSSFNGSYTITATTATTFTVGIGAATLPATGTGSGFVVNSAATGTGWLNQIYANTGFTGSPGRVGTDSSGPVTLNDGVYGSGTPDPALIGVDTFSIRWSGQVQPQFSEEYTFVVHADEGALLKINGQVQELRTAASTIQTGSTYHYTNATGNAIVNYGGLIVKPGQFAVGQSVRLDPTSGSLNHAPAIAPTYRYDDVTGDIVVNYSNLTTVAPGSFVVNETVELDPTSGSIGALGLLPYVITAATSNTFTVNAGPLSFTPTLSIASISTGSPCTVTTVLPHGLATGAQAEIKIASVSGGTFATAINGLHTVTSTGPTTFTVPVDCTAAPAAGTGTAVISGNITISDNRTGLVTAVHATGAGTYSYNTTTGDTVITYAGLAGANPGSVAVGQTILLDPTNGNLSALTYLGYTVTAATATTFTVNFGAGTFATGTGTIAIIDPANAPNPAAATGFSVNLGAGKYADNSTGAVSLEIANRALRDWSSFGNERYVRIPMIGGVRYDIQLDFFENAGFARSILSWYSPSQPRQVIPSTRLYPDSMPGVTQAPPILTSPTSAVALIGGPFSYALAGSNGSNISISGNPAWLSLSGGVLSGTPPAGTAGNYQILVTTTGPNGTGTSVINLEVQDTGGTITREFWNGIAGTSVTNIPTGTAPSGTESLSQLASATDFGDNYGARIRGYITAPETGNYYFWIAASNAAELWIANDDESVNVHRRARVLTGSPTPQNWSAEAAQKSPWLALEAGKRYYIEILHKAGVGAGDNLAVGWLKPGQSGTAPSEVVPGYVLSPYVAPAPGSTPGTLYVATMLAQGGAITNGVGVATLRLSEDETVAYVKFDDDGFETPPYNGLTGIMTDWHVHSDPYLTHSSFIIYDGAEPLPGDGPQPDGSHKWNIIASGTLSAAEVREVIKQGKAYINIHTTAYLNGEIRGNFTTANGSRTFTPPPAPPAWTDDSNSNAGAVRFLTQATFGANIADITALKALAATGAIPAAGIPSSRYNTWIEDQFTKPASHTLAEVERTENASAQGGAFDETLTFNAWWRNSIAGDDQLRQRVAFALSEIHVVSAAGPLDNNARSLAFFYDMLADHAFGNFRDLLEQTTLTWTMGRYLDMFRNDKPDFTTGRIPNENYAREIKQLFSVGLFDLWPDGTLKLNSKDELIPTYTQREIVGFAHVFTGWDYGYDGAYRTALNAPANVARNMREVPARHFTGEKRLLNNEVLPGLQSVGGQPLDPYATHTTAQFNDPVYQSLAGQELDASHDQLFNHPNVGPFICRQLIQRLVTSHPSRDYLYRVVQKFNDNGSGVRGDLKAVIKAILLDYEARSGTEIAKATYGKQREPVLRVAAAGRAFRPTGFSGTYAQTGTRTITVTTATPHRLQNGNNVFLDFTSGSPAPWIGTYSATSTGTNTFTVQAAGWATGTYNIPANSTTCTVTMSNHWLQVGHRVFMDFTSGLADGVAGTDGAVYTLLTATAETGTNGTFTFAVPTTSASTRSGNMMLPRFNPGSYTSAASGLPAPQERRVTMDTNTDHHLNVGDQVQINFFAGNPLPTDMVVTVESVVDLNTWTFLATATGTNLGTNQGNNSVYQFPLLSQPLTRNGNIASRPSTFAMGNTDADIDQSPLNSPTVFNFYLPDYKFPGTLAAQGLTTPEFQETAETSVIRQANFLERGIFALGNDNGLTSFRSGSNALVMDLGNWIVDDATNLGLGAPSSTTLPWTHNQNVSMLIDQLSTLLTGNQLSTDAKNQIRDLVSLQISSIGTGAASTINTLRPHGFTTGDVVVISGVSNGTFASSLNSTSTARTVTVTSPTTFTIPVLCSAAPTAAGVANAHASYVAYNNGSTVPSMTERRNRLRTILHLILTSADFTIQR